ncbi:MAG: hypothetical protein HY782_19430 [Chloroflexi bacterium]|nr:hypothetical protein [Chloroflexota bacterium]
MKTILLGLVLLGAVILATLLASAAPARASLPPRPTLPIVAESPPPKPIGGWIELRAQNVPSGNVWTIVQWQDALQARHDVIEWRGRFDEIEDGTGRKTWWVAQKDFGMRLRWLVYTEAREQVVCESQPFDAPRENRQTVVVAVDCK